MGRHWSMFLEFFSFGLKIPSDPFKAAGTSPFLHTTFRSHHNCLVNEITSCTLCTGWRKVQQQNQIFPCDDVLNFP
ncbi:hypothetical protein DPMN_194901 [Dreissena polymorpha]|uniref:Uncharacterized protein n=1 Tax=Dreissena polymorpha TaxID=45954 RepID=A0A9D4B7E9_DREPO|nr:hypothetical protein DPMN_194901 [Dreissena polymorpha]